MAMTVGLRVAAFLIVATSTFAEETTLTAHPKKAFLNGNSFVEITFRYTNPNLTKEHFKGIYEFFHDNVKMKEGTGPNFVIPGKPYVDYVLKITEAGMYLGRTEGLEATAYVYREEAEEPPVVARVGEDLILDRDNGIPGSVKLWEVDGYPVQNQQIFAENGSLTIRNIDENIGRQKIGYSLFFSQDDLESYRRNRSSIQDYSTTRIRVPVIVFKTVMVKPNSSSYSVMLTSWKKDAGILVCQNSNQSCEPLGNNGTFEVQLTSDCRFVLGNVSLNTCQYKDTTRPKTPNKAPEENGSLWYLGLIVAIVVVGGAVGLLMWKKKFLCFKDDRDTTVSKKPVLKSEIPEKEPLNQDEKKEEMKSEIPEKEPLNQDEKKEEMLNGATI